MPRGGRLLTVAPALLIAALAAACGGAATPSTPSAPPAEGDGAAPPENATSLERLSADGGGCLQPGLVPAFRPPLPDGDCVTAVDRTADGGAFVGTSEGLLGVVDAGGALKTWRPPEGTGPVTGVMVYRLLVSFVVDQGVGLFLPAEEAFIRLESYPIGAERGDLGARGRLNVDGFYIDLDGPARPLLSESGLWYEKAIPDGTLHRLAIGGNQGPVISGALLPSPGSLPLTFYLDVSGDFPESFPPLPEVTPSPAAGR